MKKLLLYFLIFAFTVGLMTGCGSTGAGDPDCADILISVRDKTEEGFDTLYSYTDSEYRDSFDHMYGVKWDMIDDGGILYTANGAPADEISLIHLKDQNDISIAREKFSDRIEDRRNQFSGYMPEETYKVDNAVVIVQGNYVALIIADDPAMIEAEVRSGISNFDN